MSKHRVLMLCVLLAVTAMLVPRPASAADSYEVVVEYDGPYFHVVNAPTVDQLVEDPLIEVPFITPRSIAASNFAGDSRRVNYVLDSGTKRILAFEANMDIARMAQSGGSWDAGGIDTAGEFDDNQVALPEWAAGSARWIVPFSEVVKIEGETWTWVADLTNYDAADEVYTIDYDDATNAPEILFPPNALSATSNFNIAYAISDYQGGGVAAFGIGDVDQGNRSAAVTSTAVLIDESTGGGAPSSLEDLRCIFAIEESGATRDELWVVDAADNSANGDEFLFVYAAGHDGSVGFVEQYDDLVDSPMDVWVASGPTAQAAAVTVAAAAHATAGTVIDENQVTGHTYSIAQTTTATTITDLTTNRVLIDAGTCTNFRAAHNYVIPGVDLTWDTAVTATAGTITTTRQITQRYAFLADTGNDRIKVIEVADFQATTGDDLPGDANTVATQATTEIGGVVGQDYYFTTPATVPESWKTGAAGRQLKENSVTMTEDPDGTPVVWTRVNDLLTAGPADDVFQIDWWKGTVLFGDGTHGALPPASTEFGLTYTTTPDVIRYGTSGTGAGQFAGPSGICAMWSSDLGVFNVYVADKGNNRIQKFHFHPEDGVLNIEPYMEFVCEWNYASDASDLFDTPTDISVQRVGAGAATFEYFVAVVDKENHRVVLYEDTKFNTNNSATVPAFETTIGGSGATLGSYNAIGGVTLLETALNELEIYVADEGRNVITKYVKAPSPSIAIVVGSTLPNSFPPTSSYGIAFTTTNPPEGGWVSFYYDTAGSYSASTSKLCFTAGSIAITGSPATWSFAASPGGLPADGDYYIFAILRDAAGNSVATDATTATELLTINSTLVPAVQVRDALDNDGFLLIAPLEERIVKLELSYPDSASGCSFVGTFPTTALEITGITSGEGWHGGNGAYEIWNAAYDNTAGTFTVNSAVTGMPQGLSGSGDFLVARVAVKAKDVLSPATRFIEGTFGLGADSKIFDYAGNVTAVTKRALSVQLAYVGDIADNTLGAGGSVGTFEPDPDGYMTIQDLNIFVTGWNGSMTEQDPICDMGPYSGTSPKYVPVRDGKYTVEDLDAFTGNWAWFSANGYAIPAFRGAGPLIAFSPLGEPIEGATTVTLNSQLEGFMPGELVEVQVEVDNAQLLTTAMVRVAFDPAELELVGTARGEMLLRNNGNVLFNTIRGEGVCEVCMGRISRTQPGVSGNGTIATMTFRIVAPPETGLSYGFELFDATGTIMVRGTDTLQQLGERCVDRVLLHQNYPNPLNPNTNIVFALPTRTDVDLAVFDLTGRRIKTLVSGAQDGGVHSVIWDGRDQGGNQVASGVYFYTLRAGETNQSRRVVVAR